jgi:hypothetical protein
MRNGAELVGWAIRSPEVSAATGLYVEVGLRRAAATDLVLRAELVAADGARSLLPALDYGELFPASAWRPGELVIPNLTTATLNVPLRAPQTEYMPRINQLDLSLAKTVTVRGVRIAPKVDIFNALTSDRWSSVATAQFGTAAYLLGTLATGYHRAPLGSIAGFLWFAVNSLVCLWIARIGLDRESEKG